MQTDRCVASVEIPDEFVGMIRWDCQGSDGDSALGYYAGEGQGTMVRGQRGFLRGLWFHLMLGPVDSHSASPGANRLRLGKDRLEPVLFRQVLDRWCWFYPLGFGKRPRELRSNSVRVG